MGRRLRRLGNPRPERFEVTGLEPRRAPGPGAWTPNEAARVDWWAPTPEQTPPANKDTAS
jgi:hypothetical protein